MSKKQIDKSFGLNLSEQEEKKSQADSLSFAEKINNLKDLIKKQEAEIVELKMELQQVKDEIKSKSSPSFLVPKVKQRDDDTLSAPRPAFKRG